jgi:hypothetical protein
VINRRWIWAFTAQSNCCVFTLHLLLLFCVYLRPGWLLRSLLLPSSRWPIESNRIELRSKEVDCCIYRARSPITSCGRSTLSPMIIARACAYAEAVLSTRRSYRPQRHR